MDYKRILSNAAIIFLITMLTSMATGNPNVLIPTTSAIITGLIAGLTEIRISLDEKKGVYLQNKLFTSKLILF